MGQPTARGYAAPAGVHLVLYDGVCGLCNRLLHFLLRHDRQRAFSFAALQSSVGRAIVARSGGNPDDLSTLYVVAGYQTPHARVLTKSDAALFVLGKLDAPWKAAPLLRVVPKAVRDLAYDLIARRRYRWFGRSDTCLVPGQEARGRFID